MLFSFKFCKLYFDKGVKKLEKLQANHLGQCFNFTLRSFVSLSADFIYYRPQRSCEGYVFTGICLSTEGWGCLVPGGVCSGGGGVCCWGGVCSRGAVSAPGGCLLQGVSHHALRQTPPGRDGYSCGRYASYWNAFLFIL